MVAKYDGQTTYVFNNETGEWDVDMNRLLTDRLLETDGEDVGRCEMISQAEAQRLIGYEEDGTE